MPDLSHTDVSRKVGGHNASLFMIDCETGECLGSHDAVPTVLIAYFSDIGAVSVLICFIDPRVRKNKNEASSCPGIFSRTLRFGHAASGGALAPEPLRTTGVGPEVIVVQFCHFFRTHAHTQNLVSPMSPCGAHDTHACCARSIDHLLYLL